MSPYISSYTTIFFAILCIVCICVLCMRERDREKERNCFNLLAKTFTAFSDLNRLLCLSVRSSVHPFVFTSKMIFISLHAFLQGHLIKLAYVLTFFLSFKAAIKMAELSSTCRVVAVAVQADSFPFRGSAGLRAHGKSQVNRRKALVYIYVLFFYLLLYVLKIT